MNKILFIASDNRLSSGAFRSMAKLCELLKNQYGLTPVVVVKAEGDGEKLLDEAGIEHIMIRSHHWVIPVDYKWSLKNRILCLVKKLDNRLSALKIASYIKRENIDIVHINTTYTYVGALAALQTGVPFIWHLRELLEEDQNNKLWNESCFKLINRASKVVAISDFVYQKYINKISDSRLVMIPNGVSPEEYYCNNKKIFQDNIVEIVCVGNMNGTKGQDVIIRAAAKLLQKKIRNWHISLVGSGLLEEEYRTLTRKLKVEDFIKFCGIHKNVSPFYQTADIAIMSSKAEAFGRTTVEAMFAGCVILGSNSGATPELLENESMGYLFEAGNDDSLADSLEYILKHREEAAVKAKNGQASALSKYTADVNAANIVKLYSEVLKGKKQ